MPFLVDTGILLRLLERTDPQHGLVREALRALRKHGENLIASPQNAAEFWNVCTRPATARGGLGLQLSETDRRLRIVERVVQVLPDPATMYGIWRKLIISQGVMGVQVHDARLVAFMLAHGLTSLVTLNAADFGRYPGVTALTPAAILAAFP